MSSKDDLKPHVIILPSYCPVAICMTKEIAETMAKMMYIPGRYTIRLATEEDVKYVME